MLLLPPPALSKRRVPPPLPIPKLLLLQMDGPLSVARSKKGSGCCQATHRLLGCSHQTQLLLLRLLLLQAGCYKPDSGRGRLTRRGGGSLNAQMSLRSKKGRPSSSSVKISHIPGAAQPGGLVNALHAGQAWRLQLTLVRSVSGQRRGECTSQTHQVPSN